MGDFYLLFYNFLCYLKEHIYLNFIIRKKPKELFYFSAEKSNTTSPTCGLADDSSWIAIWHIAQGTPSRHSSALHSPVTHLWHLNLLTSPFLRNCSSEHCLNFPYAAFGANVTWVWLVAVPSTSCVISVPVPSHMRWDTTPSPWVTQNAKVYMALILHAW